MITRTLPILNAATTTTIGASPYVSPPMKRSIVDAVVMVTVEAVSGVPATATISPTFEVWHSVVGGNYFEVYETTNPGLPPTLSWFPIVAASNPSMLPDGDWPATTDVSGATVGAPVSVFRSIIPRGAPWRIKIAWALTGGIAPTLTIDAICYQRETYSAPRPERLA
jgi:hypothetical protein